MTTAGSILRDAPAEPDATTDRELDKMNKLASIPFIAMHFVPLLAIITGVTWKAVILCVVLYWGRMFFITAGYHRYFSHRSYKLGRVAQFLMAVGGASAAQKGPLWWAAHHRDHHRFSDTEKDIHSPLRGFWWSHVGWILSNRHKETKLDRVRDLHKFPELRLVEKYQGLAPFGLGVASFLIAGWSGVVVGFALSTVVLWHATFTVNSLAHLIGRKRYQTSDDSRNSWFVAILTSGEGWHNNHHHYQASARQGFFWWEWDPTYYGLKLLSWVRVVRGLRRPPARVKRPELAEEPVVEEREPALVGG